MLDTIYCCPNCFGDRGLRESIFPRKRSSHGQCSFCGSVDVDLIEPHLLAEYFELLVSIYNPDPAGRSLGEWLRCDWKLFDHPNIDSCVADELLSIILGGEVITKEKFSPSPDYQSHELSRWEALRDELMHENRYFPDAQMDPDRLAKLLELLLVKDRPETWFRARVSNENTMFEIDKMGSPPERKATHGRANPPGIPYLYLASDELTAVAEIRPHTGQFATVASFTVPTDISVVDLRDPRKLVSPFILDEGDIGQLRVDIPFLERLGEELTRPVVPDDAAIDYVPSQYLCEFIKKQNIGGVTYRSSVGEGMNLALFDPKSAEMGTCTQFRVGRVAVEVEAL